MPEPCANRVSNHIERLTVAVALFNVYRTPERVARTIGQGGFLAAVGTLTGSQLAEAAEVSDELASRNIDVCFFGEAKYPQRLALMNRPPAVLFTWGNQDLLNELGLGMCGSRNASERGIAAARHCGVVVADHKLMIISGYARGVDTETHLAALGSGGRTAIVLAEGILHFRRKRAFAGVDFDPTRIVVISQFAPSQVWSVGAAMSRNRVIVGLGKALVVIEAGETGGTLDAGMQALKAGKPVLALEFSDGATPAGNRLLHEKGAVRINNKQHLADVLRTIRTTPEFEPISSEQLSLL